MLLQVPESLSRSERMRFLFSAEGIFKGGELERGEKASNLEEGPAWEVRAKSVGSPCQVLAEISHENKVAHGTPKGPKNGPKIHKK